MPPVVERQKPGGNHKVRAKPGSVLAKAIPVEELPDSWIKMLVYGNNGVGKTTLACDFETPLLLVSFERVQTGGARSVRKKPGVTFIKPGWPEGKSYDADDVVVNAAEVIADTEKLAEELHSSCPFKTVVFDHVTVFQDWVLENLIGERLPEQLNFGAVSGDQYRDRAEITKTQLRKWVDLPCNTIFLGKEKDHNPPKEERVSASGKLQPDMRARFLRGMQQESFVTVDLGGGTAGWLQDTCDFVCRLYFDREVVRQVNKAQGRETVSYQETGKFVRALRTTYHPNYAARFRTDEPGKLPEAIENPTAARVLAAIRGELKETDRGA